MRKPNLLAITKYLAEVQDEILQVISENKNTLISSNPASGKTTLFANLCIDHISSKKKSRIVFCAPYLIIQEQFKQRLANSGAHVDFELNGENPRKKLNDTDRIITSTFKSFPKISEKLNPEDIVIIDEAHSLLNVFSDKKTKEHNHYGTYYKALYTTKAKIVLMTGTPVDSFYYWFDNLKELRIIKNSRKAKINIQYSSHNTNDIVIQFAEECVKFYGEEALNVIYIKSKSKCEKHAEIIRSLGYKGWVLTSEKKSSKEYKELVESSIISKQYQFLLTTNVISTGTNILNENMGKALMLNEYDPIEIKQFSKRFRKKLDIEIDVVNKIQKASKDKEEIRNKLKKERAINRKYLSQIKRNIYSIADNDNIEVFNFNAFGGEASQLNPKTRRDAYIKRNLLQEIYYHQEITKTYNDRNELSKALNQFDDIISVELEEYKKGKIDFTFDEKAYQQEKKEHFDNVINNFIEQPEIYLSAYSRYIQAYHKYSELIKINNILANFEIDENTVREANKTPIDPELLEKIISQLISHYPLFSLKDPKLSLTRCLSFIKDVPLNKQSKHLIALWFNNMFHTHFKIPDYYDLQNRNLIDKKVLESSNMDLIYFLLNQTFQFIMRNEEIYYQHFKDSIINSSSNKDFDPDGFFPWRSQLTINGGRIMNMDKNFGFGLLYSIFAIKGKQVQKNHPKVLDKTRVNTLLPSDWDSAKSFNCLNEEELKTYISGLRQIKTLPPTWYYKGLNLNESERVIIDRNYLTIIANHSA